MAQETGGPSQWKLDVLGGLLGLVAAGAFAWGSREFCLDDAYIHLAYAKSLRLGEGFSYNPDDWELGTTSPLWAVLLTPLAARTHTVLAVKVLGVVLHALACGLLPALMRALTPVAEQEMSGRRGSSFVLLLPTALFALHPVLLQGASSGMEVALATLLLEGIVLFALRGHHDAAAVLSWMSVWTRPEALFFDVVLALGLSFGGDRRALRIGFSAIGALASWAGYCLAVAGQLLPNTFYAKTGDRALAVSLRYLVESVLMQEAWLVGVGGLVLAYSFSREERGAGRFAVAAVSIAWAGTLGAVAVSRTLHPDVLFYMQRYFAPFAFVPPAVIGAALCTRPARDVLWLVPCLSLLLVRLPGAHATMRLQEHGITALHTNVAAWVSQTLPANSRVLVEGAGALRYFTPRSQVILDFLGLNRSAFVHALHGKGPLHACLVWWSKPDFAVMPSELLRPMSELFHGDPLRQFDDPTYAQSRQHWHRRVLAFRVLGPTPSLRERCSALVERAR